MIALALATPLVMLLACLWDRAQRVMPRLLALAPLPALAAALLSAPPLVIDQPLVHIVLEFDRTGAMLTGAAALLWCAGGAAATVRLRGDLHPVRFTMFWLLTQAGSLAVFMAADLAGFFVAYTVVSLAAYGLVLHDQTPRATRAAGIYAVFAVLGEGLVLLGFVMLAAAAPGQRLLIRDALAALPPTGYGAATLAALIGGFGLKMGLVPGHVWMPPTYRAAPAPAAAVLSGAAVKAGVIGLIRFLPLDAPWPQAGTILAALGFASAFFGVAMGITRSHPKTVLAFSSISQMGVIAALAGTALMAGHGAGQDGFTIGFYAMHHLLAKGALFLAVAVALTQRDGRMVPLLLPACLVALGMGGLPLTGGAVAKLATKDLFGTGLPATLSALSAAGTTLLMLHFLRRLAHLLPRGDSRIAPLATRLAWWTIAAAALVLPWMLYPGAFAGLLTAEAIWSSLWPVLLGGVLAALLFRLAPLRDLPEDTELILAEATIGRPGVWNWLDRLDHVLRRWSAAGLALVVVALALAALLMA